MWNILKKGVVQKDTDALKELKNITESCFMRHTQAVSKADFIEILVRLCKGVCRIKLWLISWCLHYDSTPF
jgi:hypothetical protein